MLAVITAGVVRSHMSDSDEYYHNKGQKDGYEGDYDPPHGVIDELSTWSRAGIDKNIVPNTHATINHKRASTINNRTRTSPTKGSLIIFPDFMLTLLQVSV